VLLHKLRQVISKAIDQIDLSGEVEVDGAYFGGYVKLANYRKKRKDRRVSAMLTGKRLVVVVARERGGKAITLAASSERASVPHVVDRIHPRATVYADESSAWSTFHAEFNTRRINHSECFSDGEACTNQAESFFSRLRRAEVGIHHRISTSLSAYAAEMAWRENHARSSSYERYIELIGLGAAYSGTSLWRGYWQRYKSRSTAPARTLAPALEV
jgi:hypothetical protein